MMMPVANPAFPTPDPGRTGNGHPAGSSTRGRPSWSGLLRISLVAVPVKAYPAVSSTTSSHFHMLHAGCGQRIQYRKHCPQHGPIPTDAIVRGYEYARDQHLVIEPEELDRLRPARDKALVLEQFMPPGEIDPVFFAGRSLYLLPEGSAAQHPYYLLAETMQEAGKAALGRVVFSSQRQLVLVRAVSRLLVVDVLHNPAQVRAASAWEGEVGASATSDAERHLARQLLALASGPLDWGRYRDTSAEELAALVEAKLARQEPQPASEEPAVVLRLLDALKKSVDQARQGKADNGSKARKPRGRRAMG